MLWITKLRKARGWSKNRLSQEARMAASDIGRIESGRLKAYDGQLLKLAKVLGVPEQERHRLLTACEEVTSQGEESEWSPSLE